MLDKALPEIPLGGSLSEWQRYTDSVVKARGWDSANDLEVFLLLSEEIGELAKAIRQHRKLFVEIESGDGFVKNRSADSTYARALADEFADVLSYLFDLASRLGIDLNEALTAKEKVNRMREWTAG